MQSIIEVINNFKKEGIAFSLDGDELLILSNVEITQKNISIVKNYKQEIISFLKQFIKE